MTEIAQVLYDLVMYILQPFYDVLAELGFDYNINVIMGYSYYDLINFVMVGLVWFMFVYAVYKFFNFIFVVLIKGVSV